MWKPQCWIFDKSRESPLKQKFVFFESNPLDANFCWRRRFGRGRRKCILLWDNFPLGGFNDCAVIFFFAGVPCKCVYAAISQPVYLYLLSYIYCYPLWWMFSSIFLARAVFSVASRICSVNYKLVHHWRQLCMLSGDTVTKVRHTTSDTQRAIPASERVRSELCREERENERCCGGGGRALLVHRRFLPSSVIASMGQWAICFHFRTHSREQKLPPNSMFQKVQILLHVQNIYLNSNLFIILQPPPV